MLHSVIHPPSFHLALPLHTSSFPILLSPSAFHHQLRLTANVHLVSVRAARPEQLWLLSEEPTSSDEEGGGPIELPPSSSDNSIFATSDDPSTLQIATSVLLTGAISIFLFRSLRRRAKRAKELQFRSSGAKKSLKEEALDSLKAMKPGVLEEKSPPSAVQAFLGALSAGVIALILYKFTTTIEASLNRQTISDNISVRQITVTIRTIINGLCYLATFIFGLNSVGLFLYSGQLALNSLMGDSTGEDTPIIKEAELSSDPMAEKGKESSDSNTSSEDMQ